MAEKLSISEVVSKYKVTKKRVYDAIKAGKLKGEKIKNAKNVMVWQFSPTEIEKWTKSITTTTKPKVPAKKTVAKKPVKKVVPKKTTKPKSTVTPKVKPATKKSPVKKPPVTKLAASSKPKSKKGSINAEKSLITLILSLLIAGLGLLSSVIFKKKR
jgi:hypothetical protein